MTLSNILQYLKEYKEFLSFLAGCLPFIVLPRNIIMKQQDDSDTLSDDVIASGNKYSKEMAKFIENCNPTFNDCSDFNSCGAKYFQALTKLCERIQLGILNTKTVKQSHLPIIKKVIESRLIEKHYEQLSRFSNGEIQYDKSMFESIYTTYTLYIKGDSVSDYRLKPLKWFWQKVRCFAIPFLCFVVLQLLLLVPTPQSSFLPL
jgi:hypothetical protein